MSTAGLQHDYVELDDLVAHPAPWWESVLGVVGFDKLPRLNGVRVPLAASMTRSLSAADELCEVWRLADAGASLLDGALHDGRVRYRYNDQLLFGAIAIEENLNGGAQALLRATMSAYEEIFEVLEATDHHLIRVWNYLPEINGEVDGDERYRHFNLARQNAFRAYGRAVVGSVPAACALGSPPGSPISIYFLASRLRPIMIENPRQISAYHYPPEFGHSPTFSRACVLRGVPGTNLFVSGTASILGHETIHLGDVTAQTHETLANISALLDEANRVEGGAPYRLDGLKYKVYIREPDDLEAVENALATSLQPLTPIVYLQADVCRAELLVEIEATGAASPRCPNVAC